jgi:hypothetical protein
MLHAPLLLVLLIAIAIFVAQYGAMFQRQQIAGPVSGQDSLSAHIQNMTVAARATADKYASQAEGR